MFKGRFLIWSTLFLLLQGCGGAPPLTEVRPDDFPYTMETFTYKKALLPVSVWMPVRSKSPRLRVYIEGDGRAWIRAGRPSMDPTPVNRLVHRLMLEDSSPDVAYLSQPCQYVMNSACNRDVWTFGRYSEKVIRSMNQAVSEIKQRGNYKQLELVGYSGGGAVALLLAAGREDVVSVRTIAGNLEPPFTNSLHGVSATPAALNPADYTEQLRKVPQIHFVGADDSVIPETVSQNYVRAFNDTSCISIRVVAADHRQGWVSQWRQLLNIQPECKP